MLMASGAWCCSDALSFERSSPSHANCQVWYDIRSHMITSSNFFSVLHRKNPSDKFLHTLFDGQKLDKVPTIDHGRFHESVAVEAYAKLKSGISSTVYVKACDIILNPVFRFLVASQDSIVFDFSDQPQRGLLEVKWSYSPFIAG